jgi:hypothetical protein
MAQQRVEAARGEAACSRRGEEVRGGTASVLRASKRGSAETKPSHCHLPPSTPKLTPGRDGTHAPAAAVGSYATAATVTVSGAWGTDGCAGAGAGVVEGVGGHELEGGAAGAQRSAAPHRLPRRT